MPAEQEDRRIGDGDRRESPKPSAWQSPSTWMTLCGLLLAFLGYVSNQLHDINNGINSLNNADAHKTEQIQNLKDQVGELKGAKELQVQINQQIRDRLAKLEGAQQGAEKKP